MSQLRKIFYKVNLKLNDNKVLPITIATSDINKIPELVEKHKVLYLMRGFDVTGFVIADTRFTIQMSEKQYQDELSYCDIVDDDGGYATGPATVVRILNK